METLSLKTEHPEKGPIAPHIVFPLSHENRG